MVSLVDLAPMKLPVPLRGETVYVYGIGADTIVRLLQETPDLRRVLAGKMNGDADMVQNIVQAGPRIVGTIIAAGMGESGEEAINAAAKNLSVGEQFQLLEKIVEATFPQGLKVFLDGLGSLMGAEPQSANEAERTKAADTTSQEQSRT